ncbi:hypothetical protein JZ785_14855 [Alicyclobacillus curvatus]|jgi:hypothetical protein|nr:hypothetical protein JZ785_14855 [Alicyclobacillus curvatus]
MPSIIIGGALNSNSPQANSGCFVGSYNFGGWDINMKQTVGAGGTFGVGNIVILQKNIAVDQGEGVDGAMNDLDVKHQVSVNI